MASLSLRHLLPRLYQLSLSLQSSLIRKVSQLLNLIILSLNLLPLRLLLNFLNGALLWMMNLLSFRGKVLGLWYLPLHLRMW